MDHLLFLWNTACFLVGAWTIGCWVGRRVVALQDWWERRR